MQAEQILAKAQTSRAVIQQFVALADSLEWRLGQEYLRQRGNKAFLSDASPVPFVINNDGTLSRNAAEVFFASLVDAEEKGPLAEEIFVLELGIGVGLFARYFLDALRELCRKAGKDYYDRLTYIAADRSARMLLDVARHGVLGEHLGHYVLRLVDALQPETLLRDALFGVPSPPTPLPQGERGESPSPATALHASGERGARPLRAVFLNYLLDCLPAAVLDLSGLPETPAGTEAVAILVANGTPQAAGVKQLCVRTCVARNVRLEDYTDLTAEALAERARINDAAAQRELLEVYGLFASEYDYRPVDIQTLPLGEFALAFGRTRTKKLLHSYGAIQCLQRLLELVHEDGFILANDYGQTQVTAKDEFEHQRFSLATFVGVNFSELRAYFGETRDSTLARSASEEEPSLTLRHEESSLTRRAKVVMRQYLEPHSESGSIHSRLLGHNLSYKTAVRFQECFSEAASAKLQEPLNQARECLKVGRFELGSTYYRQALELQPVNWVLLNEVAQFLIFSLRDVKAGIDIAKVALRLNPACSSELWNTLGDGLFEYGRHAEARSAYQKALEVNAADVRARYNLAWVHQREKDYGAALGMIAEALALDKTGQYRERLLAKQQEVVAQQVRKHQTEYLLLVNLVSKYPSPTQPERPKQEASRPGDVELIVS
jgi:tetratricopeptide (TPR) repeat protein